MQKCATLRKVYFEKTIREYKNAATKNLKIVKHANVVILQNQSQFESKKSTLLIDSNHYNNKDKKQQCIYECMHN